MPVKKSIPAFGNRVKQLLHVHVFLTDWLGSETIGLSKKYEGNISYVKLPDSNLALNYQLKCLNKKELVVET